MKPCAGCDGFFDGPGQKCPRCRPKRRNVAHHAAYATAKWHKVRALVIEGVRCVDGCGRPATEADHVPPRQVLVAIGVNDPDHPRWLEPRCKRCHTRVTSKVDMPILAELDRGVIPVEVLAGRAIEGRRRLREQREAAPARPTPG